MKICMVGAGYVGLVSATCFSEFGWTVTCIDKDTDKIEQLRQGQRLVLRDFSAEERVRV